MIKMVVGFLFNPEMDRVVLIKKNRPDWQKGYLNGVGGHIKDGEDSYTAMKREFEEEAGLSINDWVGFCEISGKDNTTADSHHSYICYFFYAISEKIDEIINKTDEELQIVWSHSL